MVYPIHAQGNSDTDKEMYGKRTKAFYCQTISCVQDNTNALIRFFADEADVLANLVCLSIRNPLDPSIWTD